MAMIELCPESPPGWAMSPRISFSHDLAHSDGIPVDRPRPDDSLVDSSPDFDFCVGGRFEDDQSSSADVLFSDGMILPREVTTPPKPPKAAALPPTPADAQPPLEEPKKESLREIMAAEGKAPQPRSSFWRFTRSSSLNCSAGQRRSLISKLPLLNRSNSTGSVTQNPKKDCNKHLPKQKPSPPPSSSTKPPAGSRGGRGGGYGNGGVRTSPALNVPPLYISAGTTNLFGLGYLFRTIKDGGRNRKRMSS